jgi:hypothetical protein
MMIVLVATLFALYVYVSIRERGFIVTVGLCEQGSTLSSLIMIQRGHSRSR